MKNRVKEILQDHIDKYRHIEKQLLETQAKLEDIQCSRGWYFLQKYYAVRDRILPKNNLRNSDHRDVEQQDVNKGEKIRPITKRKKDNSCYNNHHGQNCDPSIGSLQGINKLPLLTLLDFLKNSTQYFQYLFQQNKTSNVHPEHKSHENKKILNLDIRLIAFYLPQFHPITENDQAWGKGFTEWTNTTKAIPQFDGHYQPRMPGELGFYDLRLKEVQKRQIELAKNYGLYGFCYHYYWFGGKRVLDLPLQQILNNPDLDFPFCINWANENWSKRWNGLDDDIILAQKHSPVDDVAFLNAIKPILADKRYIKIHGKPLLMVYRPNLFPDAKSTTERWRNHARKIGMGEIYLVLTHSFEHLNPLEYGFDAAVEFAPNTFHVTDISKQVSPFNPDYHGIVYDYKEAIQYSINFETPPYTKFRCIFPSWDNEARKPGRGSVFVGSTPSIYGNWLKHLLTYTEQMHNGEEKLLFVNAWNEWAEGAYLEPDIYFGYAYLDETYKQLAKFDLTNQ